MALLLTVGHEFKLKSLEPLHQCNYTLAYEREQRSSPRSTLCIYVACSLGLRELFTGVCIDFESQLVEFDGEDDHVHLLVNYPPKVSVSALVNSLKGVSSRILRQRSYPSIRKKLWGGAL
jgi:hypothetical protein